MTTHRKPSAILRAIGEKLADERHWTQDAYARDANGYKIDANNPKAVCWCWDGALWSITWREDWPARVKVRAYMTQVTGDQIITPWNDTHTHAEVIAANARAVELAEADGQ